MSTREEIKLANEIDEMVGALCDKIIVWPSPWNVQLPEPVLKQVPIERMILLMRYYKGDIPEMTATDSEAILYMYPRSMEAPMDHDWTNIYVYMGQKFAEFTGMNWPGDMKTELTKYQEGKLAHLKRFIYERRVRARTETARQELKDKRKKKEESKPEVVQYTFEFD